MQSYNLHPVSLMTQVGLRSVTRMRDLQYATIPECATPLQGKKTHNKPKLVMSIPKPTIPGEATSSPTTAQSSSPTRQTLGISNLLLSSTLHLPNSPPISLRDGVPMLSTREPLSLQATTVNFRRFVSRSGAIFWLQDRIEEVLMWRKGGKVTLTWMAIYAFFCSLLILSHLVLAFTISSRLLSTDAPTTTSRYSHFSASCDSWEQPARSVRCVEFGECQGC